MIARQDNDWFCVIAQNLGGTLQELLWLAVIVEGIAGQEDDIGLHFSCCAKHLGKRFQAISIAEAVVSAEMQIRAVDDDDFRA
jgi:hypothetical protein